MPRHSIRQAFTRLFTSASLKGAKLNESPLHHPRTPTPYEITSECLRQIEIRSTERIQAEKAAAERHGANAVVDYDSLSSGRKGSEDGYFTNFSDFTSSIAGDCGCGSEGTRTHTRTRGIGAGTQGVPSLRLNGLELDVDTAIHWFQVNTLGISEWGVRRMPVRMGGEYEEVWADSWVEPTESYGMDW